MTKPDYTSKDRSVVTCRAYSKIARLLDRWRVSLPIYVGICNICKCLIYKSSTRLRVTDVFTDAGCQREKFVRDQVRLGIYSATLSKAAAAAKAAFIVCRADRRACSCKRVYIFENAVDAIAGARASKRSRQTGTTSFGNERGPRDRQTREPAALINRTPTQSPPARSTVPASTLPKALLYNSKFQSPNIGRSRSRLSVILFLGVSVIFFSVHGRVAPKGQREREILTSSEESHDFDWR